MRTSVSLGLSLALQIATGSAAEFVGINANTIETDEGKALLQWKDNEDSTGNTHEAFGTFELQRASLPEFGDPVNVYTGTDTATFVTGLTEGSHYYRVRRIDKQDTPGPWSETLTINVRYPSPSTVIILLTTGLIVMTATGIAIVLGHKRRTQVVA